MGGGKGGGAAPRTPNYENLYKPKGVRTGLGPEDITENADGTYSWGNYTADSRGELNRMVSAFAGGRLGGRRSRIGGLVRSRGFGDDYTIIPDLPDPNAPQEGFDRFRDRLLAGRTGSTATTAPIDDGAVATPVEQQPTQENFLTSFRDRQAGTTTTTTGGTTTTTTDRTTLRQRLFQLRAVSG